MTLSLSKPQWMELRRHGEETFPHECCGVLVGVFDGDDSKTVRAVIRCENQRTDSPQNRYFINPRELVRIQRRASEEGLDIVGFYHSHPQHPARWSQTDLQEAHWIDCSYVITSVIEGNATETNSFKLVGTNETKAFRDEEIKVG